MNRKERRFPRAASINTVLVTAVDGKPLDHFLKTHSLGLGGCGFASRVAPPVDAILDLMISLRSVAFKVTARVAYCDPSEGDQCEVGCEFLDLTTSERRIIEGLVGSHLEETPTESAGEGSARGTASSE